MVGARSAIVAIALAVAGGLGASPACAQTTILRDALFGQPAVTPRRAAPPPVARYVAETGEAFTFDRSASIALLRFDSSPEVLALFPEAGPRGDVIYKNDLGAPVLRATKVGGLTVFTRQRPAGTAVALAGETTPLRLASMGPNALLQRLAVASAKSSRSAQRLITFEADASPRSAALIADAAMVTAEAVARLSRRSDGKELVSRFDKVLLAEGKKPSAQVRKGVMTITVSPQMGLAGRPSSERIAYVAGAR